MYNILILEDNYIQLKTLSEIIKELGKGYKIYEATNIIDALSIAKEKQIDLFFLDINLEDGSGFKFAEEIRKIEIYKLTWMVFVTIYRDFMLTAFKKVHCYDYILKPYKKEKIQKLTKRLLSDNKEQVAVTKINEKYIIVPIKNIEIKIYVNEIVFVEVFLRTSMIHTIKGSFTIDYLSLKKLNLMINDKNIIQSHRSFLINISYVNKIEKTNDKTSCKIYFYNTDKIALLGHSYKKNIMGKFNNVVGEYTNE